MIGVGEVLAGKYRVEQVLGKGGMGYVVSALHTQLDQRVAVKFMIPELCAHPEAVARFLREARAAVRIRSEHVARVIDVGTMDDGTPYMVMEFLWGRDLATELEELSRIASAEAVDYVLQACEALAEAHAYGIIHRDLKPANLFLTRRPDGSSLIKVLDFGISKAIADHTGGSESLTASQSLIGSPHYMSPEQVRRPKHVDIRSDIWALGVILHELLVGSRPFAGDTPMSVLASVVSDPPPRLRELRPDLPGGLEAVILRCLEKDVRRRFSTVAELAQALAPYAPAHAQTLVTRIEGIVRSAPHQTPVGSGMSGAPPPITPLSVGAESATLPSPREPQALDSVRGSQPETETDWGRSGGIDRSGRRNMMWLAAGASVLVLFGAIMYLLGSTRSEHDAVIAPQAASLAQPSPAVTPPLASDESDADLLEPLAPPPLPSVTPALVPEVVPAGAAPASSNAAASSAPSVAPRAPPPRRRPTAPQPSTSAAPAPFPTPARRPDPLEERR